jgi:hypothetical protein
MGILVCYDDYTYDVINDYHLDYLLGKGCIVGYDNSGNWSKTVDTDQEIILLTEEANDGSESAGNPKIRGAQTK